MILPVPLPELPEKRFGGNFFEAIGISENGFRAG